MSSDRLVTVYENGYGAVRYQPTLATGARLVYVAPRVKTGPRQVWFLFDPVFPGYPRPVLYRSKRRARREAEREQGRRDKHRRKMFREVDTTTGTRYS